jgi:hypothetical protein
MTDSREQLPLLTASRLRDARACQRLHKHRYFDGYIPLEDVGPLRFGRIFHTALEAWWSSPSYDKLNSGLLSIPSEADPFEAAIVRALLVGYHERWHRESLDVLAVEGEFRVPLINPGSGAPSRTWELGGKWDAIARDGNNRVLLVEHKTTSEDITPGSEYWKRLRLDGQISIYFEGARSSGFDVAACLYDVIRKPGIRPLKATPVESRQFKKDGTLYANQRIDDEAPDDFEARLTAAISEDPNRYYGRGEIVRLESEMDEAMYDVWTLGKQIQESRLAGRFPRNPDSCVRWGRTCAYFGVCSGEASLQDEMLFRRVANVHPELTNVSS